MTEDTRVFLDPMEGAFTGLHRRAAPGEQLRLFDDSTEEVLPDADAVYKIFMGGDVVGAPEAGDGGYREVLTRAGFTEIECLDNGSSAGTWSGKAIDRDGEEVTWYQENRYPYHGFKYSVSQMSWEESVDG